MYKKPKYWPKSHNTSQKLRISKTLNLHPLKFQEIHGIRTFIPGKTIRDEQTGELVFVPGKMIFDGKNGPRFLPGQVIESEDGDERFIPGQIMETVEDGIKRFVPGMISLLK